jgi:hypothetical protein
MIIKDETTQNHRFSKTFIEKNIDGLSQKIIEKAFKTKKISYYPLIESDIKRENSIVKTTENLSEDSR